MGLSLSIPGWPTSGAATIANVDEARDDAAHVSFITVNVRKDPRCTLTIPGFPDDDAVGLSFTLARGSRASDLIQSISQYGAADKFVYNLDVPNGELLIEGQRLRVSVADKHV